MTHQSSNTEYQIRVDGTPERFASAFDYHLVAEFLEVCEENPNKYVDIVTVRTEILLSQASYAALEKHFSHL